MFVVIAAWHATILAAWWLWHTGDCFQPTVSEDKGDLSYEDIKEDSFRDFGSLGKLYNIVVYTRGSPSRIR